VAISSIDFCRRRNKLQFGVIKSDRLIFLSDLYNIRLKVCVCVGATLHSADENASPYTQQIRDRNEKNARRTPKREAIKSAECEIATLHTAGPRPAMHIHKNTKKAPTTFLLPSISLIDLCVYVSVL
jgi:hypothetical protein